jgi:hypothetical protein
MKHIKTFENYLNESSGTYEERSMLMPGSTKDEDLAALKAKGLHFKIHIEPYMGGDYEIEFNTPADAEKASDILSQLHGE